MLKAADTQINTIKSLHLDNYKTEHFYVLPETPCNC